MAHSSVDVMKAMCVGVFITAAKQILSEDTGGDANELGLCPNTVGPDGRADKILEHVIAVQPEFKKEPECSERP